MVPSSLIAVGSKLPDTISSPIPGSELSLRRFTGSSDELSSLYTLLSNPALWSGGYDLSGRTVDIADEPSLWRAIEEIWLAEGLELMVLEHPGGFGGITGIMEWVAPAQEGRGWSAVAGRTVICPTLWGSSANEESKLMIYGELFYQGIESVQCSVSATNWRSLRAVAKFGFEEVYREIRDVDGEVREFARFSIPADRWPLLRESNIDRIIQRRNPHG